MMARMNADILTLLACVGFIIGMVDSFVQVPLSTLSSHNSLTSPRVCYHGRIGVSHSQTAMSAETAGNTPQLGGPDKYILSRTRSMLKMQPDLEGNLIRLLMNPTSEFYDTKAKDMWASLSKKEHLVILQKHQQQLLTVGKSPFLDNEKNEKANNPEPSTSAPSPSTHVQQVQQKSPPQQPQAAQQQLRTATKIAPFKTDAQVAQNYESARVEQEEIERIKSNYMQKLDTIGRHSTMRLKTMGEIGLAAYMQGAKKANKLPDEVYIPPKSPSQ